MVLCIKHAKYFQGSNHIWGDSSDILQGISSTPAGELSPNEPSADLGPSDTASFLGYQFATDHGAPSQNHSLFLNHWLRPPKQSASPSPQPLDYFHYSSARFLSDQDSWTPLRITGVPANVTFSTRPSEMVQELGEFDRRCSASHYSEPSETGSQYNGLYSSDSGYSTRSCTTRSIATSYAVDSACSPRLTPQDYEHDEKMAPVGAESAHHYEPMDIVGPPESPSLFGHEVVKCDYPKCPWTGKCPSDKRKHEARHKKLFKCDVPNCTRKEGFGTINDLARHKKCVHKKEPERGPKVLYMCFGRNCPRSSKKWPRLDNFRQHLARMHNNEDADELLRRSREWYESLKSKDTLSTHTDNMSEQATLSQVRPDAGIIVQSASNDLQDPLAAIHTAFQAANSNMLSLDPVREHNMLDIDHTRAMELAELKLGPALEQNPSQPANPRHDKMDNMISEAAVSVINAMTKMINSHQRRRGHVGEDDIAEQEGELSDRNREILQKILITASELLSGNPGAGNSTLLEKTSSGSDRASWSQ
ncbi:hypothetical protein BDW72DRAFT_61074 [Aspergillus terricola var. indicus]